jgi:hypothetical protein
VPPSTRTAPIQRPSPEAPPGATELRFPEADGRRSTSATGRAILADAARARDPELAERIERCSRWRTDYISFMRELTELAADPADALAIAAAGLDSMRRHLVLEGYGGALALSQAGSLSAPAPGTGEIRGSGTRVERLEVPYGGRLLHGASLREQLERWVLAGTVEPSVAGSVELVSEHPEWLSLPGRTIVLVGAGSEIGPLGPLCSWGADVLAVDRPDPDVWARVRAIADSGSGIVRIPVSPEGEAGLDVIADLARTRSWLQANLAGSTPVLGMYGYADGGAHVLLTGAFDALATELTTSTSSTSLAYLATPTDAYLAPAGAVERARSAYSSRRARRLLQAPLKLASGGRLYRPAYATGAPVADALVSQQGPNYALAKRLQRWRGIAAEAAGQTVSFNVAPATWTKSVTKNRLLAAAYAGAHHFGIEIFEPATTRALMASLLVADLHAGGRQDRAAEHLFAENAAHGGLWSAAYEPRSALPLAALAGITQTSIGGGPGRRRGRGRRR